MAVLPRVLLEILRVQIVLVTKEVILVIVLFLYLSFDKNYRDQECLKYRNALILGKKGPKTTSSHRDSNSGTLVRDAPYSQRRPKIKKVK